MRCKFIFPLMEINRLINQQLAAARTLPVLDKSVSDNPAFRLGLKPAPLMKEVIEAIAAKHGINLYDGCPLIRLEHEIGRAHV